MFSGLIEEVGTIGRIERIDTGWRLSITCSEILSDAKIGDSISVSGACQTIEQFSEHEFTIFSIPETLAVTNFRGFEPGRRVNLERALRLGDRLGGHLVQGHVEGTAKVLSVDDGKALNIWLEYPSAYIIPKGSVTLDGISLTVMEKNAADHFRVQIIPETVRKTNIGDWRAGTAVNIETDYIVKSLDYVHRHQPR